MSNFLKLTAKYDGGSIYVNFDRVFRFDPAQKDTGTVLYVAKATSSEYLNVKESCEDIFRMLPR